MLKSHQVGGWEGFPTRRVGRGDARPADRASATTPIAAGLAEASFGAGKGLSPVFYMTIGSGIGGGLVIDGEVYRGTGKGAVEVGHLRMPTPDGPRSRWNCCVRLGHRPSGRPAGARVAVRLGGDARAVAVLDAAWDHLADAFATSSRCYARDGS